MDLKNQVCSLEFAKKLKKLGVSQHSHFKWTDWHNGVLTFGKPAENFRGEWHIVTMSVWHDETIVAAFTVAELGEMLPQILNLGGKSYQLMIGTALDKQWFVVYVNVEDYEDNAPFPFLMAPNEADARAKLLIHLIKNKSITV